MRSADGTGVTHVAAMAVLAGGKGEEKLPRAHHILAVSLFTHRILVMSDTSLAPPMLSAFD